MAPDRTGPSRSPRRVLATAEFDGEHAELGLSGQHYVLRGRAGLEQDLTEAEARYLRESPHDFDAFGEAIGIPVRGADPARGERLAELRAALPADRLSVLVDT